MGATPKIEFYPGNGGMIGLRCDGGGPRIDDEGWMGFRSCKHFCANKRIHEPGVSFCCRCYRYKDDPVCRVCQEGG